MGGQERRDEAREREAEGWESGGRERRRGGFMWGGSLILIEGAEELAKIRVLDGCSSVFGNRLGRPMRPKLTSHG